MAEIIALEANATLPCMAYLKGPYWTGLAAADNPLDAKRRALYEALERAATDLWWQGLLPAVDLDLAGKEVLDLSGELQSLRGIALHKRTTRFYLISGFAALAVTLAISTSPDSDQVIFGFGAGPSIKQSARSAMLELLMMELNLTDITADSKQNEHLAQLAQSFHTRPEKLIGQTDANYIAIVKNIEHGLSIEEKVAAIGIEVDYFDVSAPHTQSVWLAKLSDNNPLGKPSPYSQRPLI